MLLRINMPKFRKPRLHHSLGKCPLRVQVSNLPKRGLRMRFSITINHSWHRVECYYWASCQYHPQLWDKFFLHILDKASRNRWAKGQNMDLIQSCQERKDYCFYRVKRIWVRWWRYHFRPSRRNGLVCWYRLVSRDIYRKKRRCTRWWKWRGPVRFFRSNRRPWH